MNKKLVYTGLALGAFVGLVGCSKPVETQELELVTSTQEPTAVEFWHSMSGMLGETMTELVNNFNETVGKEKGITVEAVYQGGYDDLKSKTIGAIKAGNNPSIVQGTVNSIMEFTQSGYVQELNDYIFNEEIGIKDFEDIYKVYRDENSCYNEDGTYYSLPFSKSTDLLFYNKTFFEENGLTPPTTWEEATEVSKQIFELTGKPGLSIDNTPNYLITYLYQAGAGYTNTKGDILFNNETSLEALNLIQENTKNGYWRLAGEDKYSSAPFLSENVYMYIGSSAGEGYLNSDNFEWAATTIPQVNIDAPKYIQQGNNVAILNQNKTPEEVYASFEFIKYLCSYEANLAWVMNTGYLPLRESVATSDEYQSFINNTNSTAKIAGITSAENGFVEPMFSTDSINSNIVRNEIGIMIDNIVLTGADVQESLDAYENKLK